MTNPKTKNLELNLIDRTSPTTTYLNLQTNLDDNWEKIDQALGSETVDAEPIPVTLKQGMQVVNNEANRKVPLQLKSLKGRTLVNLLGRVGNCESTQAFLSFGLRASLNTTDKIIGNASMNLTAITDNQIEHYAVLSSQLIDGGSAPIDPDSYYVLIGKVKPVSGQAFLRFVIFDSSSAPLIDASTAKITGKNKWATAVTKFYTPPNSWRCEIRAQVLDSTGKDVYAASGENVNFDSIRLYKITQDEYNAFDSMTDEQIELRYPYVDDMKPILNPYVIRYGKNLLPPFTQWITTKGVGGTPRMELSDTYTGTLVADENLQAFAVDIPVVGGQTYTLSVPSLPSGGWMGVNSFDVNGSFVNAYGGYGNETTKTFTLEASVVRLKVLLSNNTSGGGSFTFTKPMLNIGPEPLPFVPREDNMQVAVTSLASSVDRSLYDELYQKEGRLYKFKCIQTVDLDGSLPWSIWTESAVDYKFANLEYRFLPGIPLGDIPSPTNIKRGELTKYDGKILPYWYGSWAKDMFCLDSHTNSVKLSITIPNSESGWASTYTPTLDEVKAYFNGWRMFQEGGDGWTSLYTSGNKWWVNRRTGTTTKTPNFKEMVWDTTNALGKGIQAPYKIQYQLATPTIEEVPSEGQISLHEGLNQVEVGAGMIVREKPNNIFYEAATGLYTINGGNGAYDIHGLSYRVEKMLAGYDNELQGKWRIARRDSTNSNFPRFGYEYAETLNFSNEKAHSVTYTVLDKYLLTGTITDIDCQYPSNMKTIVNDLVSGQVEVVRRVGVLEMQKAGKYQPQWIKATLLNGWVNFGGDDYELEYMKDELGFVHIRGVIKSGMTVTFTTIGYLPRGYRPARYFPFTVISHNGSVEVAGRLATDATGVISIRTSGLGNNWLNLNTIPPFLAEQ